MTQLCTEEEVNTKFYEDFEALIQRIPHSDRLKLLGDLNAHAGRDNNIWPVVVGKHGVENMNTNDLQLFSFCCQHGLTKTSIIFKQKNKYTTTWMYPRFKH